MHETLFAMAELYLEDRARTHAEAIEMKVNLKHLQDDIGSLCVTVIVCFAVAAYALRVTQDVIERLDNQNKINVSMDDRISMLESQKGDLQ